MLSPLFEFQWACQPVFRKGIKHSLTALHTNWRKPVTNEGLQARCQTQVDFWAKKASSLVRFGQGVAKVGEEASARVAQEWPGGGYYLDYKLYPFLTKAIFNSRLFIFACLIVIHGRGNPTIMNNVCTNVCTPWQLVIRIRVSYPWPRQPDHNEQCVYRYLLDQHRKTVDQSS